jgi:hypothetical protein
MPHPGATDPANLQAPALAQLGLSRQLKQTHCMMPHPCHGGGGYDIWFCKEQLAKEQAGEDVALSPSGRWIIFLGELLYYTGVSQWIVILDGLTYLGKIPVGSQKKTRYFT